MSLVPFNNDPRSALTPRHLGGWMVPKADRQLDRDMREQQRQAQLVKNELELRAALRIRDAQLTDIVKRETFRLEAERADDEASVRFDYLAARKRDAKEAGYAVVTEPNPEVRSLMSDWVDLHQYYEKRIYVKKFGA